MEATGKKSLFWKFASGEPLWMTEKKRAYREAYMSLPAAERAAHWVAHHKAAVVALMLVIAVTLSIAATPDDAGSAADSHTDHRYRCGNRRRNQRARFCYRRRGELDSGHDKRFL